MMNEKFAAAVSREFVKQYYTLMHRAPWHLHRFYSFDSLFLHGDDAGTFAGRGAETIRDLINQMDFKGCMVKIRQIDSQPTIADGIVLQVCGEISTNNRPHRRFLQTFMLVSTMPKTFAIQNDIFRFQEEVFPPGSSDDLTGKKVLKLSEDLMVVQDFKPSSKQVVGGDMLQPDHDENLIKPQADYSQAPELKPGSKPLKQNVKFQEDVDYPPPLIEAHTLMDVYEDGQSPDFNEASVSTVIDIESGFDSSNGSLKEEEPRETLSCFTVTTVVETFTLEPEPEMNHRSQHKVGNKDDVSENLDKDDVPDRVMIPDVKPVDPFKTKEKQTNGDEIDGTKEFPGKDDAETKKPPSVQDNGANPDVKESSRQITYASLVRNGGTPCNFLPVRGALPSAGFDNYDSKKQEAQPQPTESESPQTKTKPTSPIGKIGEFASFVQSTSKSVIDAFSPQRRDGQPNSPSLNPDKSRSLFIGNVPRECSEADLKSIFQVYGKILDIRVIASQNRNPPICFISYSEWQAVDRCLKARPIYYKDKHRLNVEVKKSKVVNSENGAKGDRAKKDISGDKKGLVQNLDNQGVSVQSESKGKSKRH